MPDDLTRRGRALLLACLAVITALSWAYTVHLSREMAAEMEHHEMMAAMGMTMDMPWTAAQGYYTFAMWTVMMVGMMAPAATPMLMFYAGARAKRYPDRYLLATVLFGLGYVAMWTGYSGAATVGQWALGEIATPRVGGAILITAGLYQWTPWKDKCLTHCRSPLGFLLSRWRDGEGGAFRMGLEHGAFCLGCCWALMAVLFAVGVMNLLWAAALTVFVLVEKVVPHGGVIARVAGVGLVGYGLMLLI